jgi:TetR/AcrR family transcriptional regulator, transcriptional repressor of bet genes
MSTAASGSCAAGLVKKSKARAPKFRRASPEARREELIAATLTCLRKFGHEGVSVRRISAAAGVTMGLITHHFRGIDTLVAAAYESLAMELLGSSRTVALRDEQDPLRCLHGYFAASFAPEAIDPALFRVWLVFWSLVPHSKAMRAVRDRTYAETRRTLESFLSRLKQMPGVPPFKVAAAAVGIAALMDGLWLELSLDPASLQAAEAVSLCDDWVRALAAGALPGLRVAASGTAARGTT